MANGPNEKSHVRSLAARLLLQWIVSPVDQGTSITASKATAVIPRFARDDYQGFKNRLVV